jgi:hypothetical protein
LRPETETHEIRSWKVGADRCEMDVGREKMASISISDSPENFSENLSRTTRLSWGRFCESVLAVSYEQI